MPVQEKDLAANEARKSKVQILSDQYAEHPFHVKPKETRGATKTYLLLEQLVEAGGAEVTLRHLMIHTHLGAVHSAVASLRERGWLIQNRTERNRYEADGTLGAVHSWYKIVIPKPINGGPG